MRRRSPIPVLAALLLLSAPALARADEAPKPARPNIVFILADDLGWTDIGCFGSTYYETPNLDRLAADGMKLTSGYTCGPNCQPTRAALLSGMYGPRTGVYTVGGTERFDSSMRPLVPVENVQKLRPGIVTVAEALKAAGYATGLFGKWHLGSDPEHHPLAQGFDEAVVSMGKHFGFVTTPPVEVPEGAYHADYMTDRAVAFLDRHKDGPFFLYLPHFVVHSPIDGKPELVERFRGKPPVGGHRNPTYAAMVASLDESVGRVVARLDELGLRENTLILFSSDNGGVGGYDTADIGLDNLRGFTDNAPLRGGKGTLYEGGIRVPWIVRWPGHVRPGTTSDRPVLSVDLLPTLCELAGAPLPAGQPVDGVSLVPLLGGDPSAALPREALFWHFPGYLGSGRDRWRTTPRGAIRRGNLKLIESFETGSIELYDLKADIGERTNLADQQPELARALHAELKAWRASVGAPMPRARTDAERVPPTRKKARAAAAVEDP